MHDHIQMIYNSDPGMGEGADTECRHCIVHHINVDVGRGSSVVIRQ